MREWIVSSSPDVIIPSRLDRWLRRMYPQLTQGVIEKSLRCRHILVNDSRQSASFRVQENDKVHVNTSLDSYLEKQEPRGLRPLYDSSTIRNLILWEDECIAVINKPRGLATQGGSGIHNHLDGHLASYGASLSPAIKYRLVHRLDRETSGLCIVAKSATTALFFMDAFKKHLVGKTYLAVVDGRPPELHGTINAPLMKKGPHEGIIVDEDLGKPAQTDYEVVAACGPYTLVAFFPRTGRTHQIRAHAAYIGCPILGDMKYAPQPTGHPLHLLSYRLSFPHPQKDRLTFQAPIPHHIEKTLVKFNCFEELLVWIPSVNI